MTFPPGSRKQELDEGLVDFIVKDSQPFTVVSDPGFRALVAKLDPTPFHHGRQLKPWWRGVIDLWKLLDRDAEEARASRNATADAIVEVQRYLSARPLERSQDPLVSWTKNKALYPNLYHLANQYLATPASSVPCERVFSKAGEIVSKKRNRLKSSTVEKLLFLNKNA
ncbi:hypothetical protein D4764_05G0011350 [Takifugu flavidus]|uniref:HAT C-terminal dimerisation domain-containing protein n=1 Tax=Takifugu flavidus TaxID=433684 RepID=A0A5C6N1S9_9TELE|nr:hypothetical protein D4764_05G0011350 [Takifugu flavidus]